MLGLVVALLASCTPTTKITGSWTRLDHEPAVYNKVVILGIAPNSTNRRIFEDHVDLKFAEEGFHELFPALDLLPPTAAQGTITKEIVFEIFETSGVDAVFTMAVRHVEDTRRYVQGASSAYVPYYNNVGFYDYYGGYAGYYYTPGHYTGSVKIYLEANFFDFKTGELIWSAESQAAKISDIDRMAKEYADIIVADFIKHEVLVLPPGKKKK